MLELRERVKVRKVAIKYRGKGRRKERTGGETLLCSFRFR